MNRTHRRSHAETGLPTIVLGPNMPGATCKGRNPRLWDRDVEGETAGQRKARYAQAVALCQACPTAAGCLAYRLSEPDLHGGIWGGCLFGDDGQRIELDAATPPADDDGRRCPECGGKVLAGGHGKKYCTTDCRDAVNDRKKAAKRKEQRRASGIPDAPAQCQRSECRRDLTPEQQQRRERYCSDMCHANAERDRMRAKRTTRRAA